MSYEPQPEILQVGFARSYPNERLDHLYLSLSMPELANTGKPVFVMEFPGLPV
jgi:hypothetical protein